MPTKQELEDLEKNCDWTWSTRNGINGYVVRGKSSYASKSIFLPAAGNGGDTLLNGSGSYGFFWSSVPDSDSNSICAWGLYLYSSSHSPYYGYFRFYGLSVRPVLGFTK